MVLAIGVVILLGVGVTLFGLRGRRTDDHPLCRRCRFDLTGRPGGSTRCPECGADLGRPQAVVVGHRRWRRGWVAAGVVLALAAAAIGGVWGWGRARHVNWWRYAPLGYLLREGSAGDGNRRSPALAELLARSGDGRLTPGHDWDRVAEAALAYQADLGRPWDSAWGDWIELARSAGGLSDDRWHSYAAVAVAQLYVVQVRPHVRRGDPVPFRVQPVYPRVGRTSSLTIEGVTLTLGWPNQTSAYPGSIWMPPGKLSTFFDEMPIYSSLGAAALDRTPDGVVPMHLRGAIQVVDSSGDAVYAGTLDLPAPFTLDPPDRPSVRRVGDPSRAAAVRASVSVAVWKSADGEFVEVQPNHPPVGLSFAILIREPGGVAKQVGSYTCPAGTGPTFHLRGTQLRSAGPDVEVILRPDPAPAARTVDTLEMWDGEIDFEKVPVWRLDR